mmetsp:Transcript_38385/g.89239  ORF Transcript_38385/g.89239 Transcript_38385/m.89239 type:complete len:193 (+) Transcript_38385:729-1307(+)
MREDLRDRHKIRIDDRLKMWWVESEHGVPSIIEELKGDGGWKVKANAKQWRQIPTTEENDRNVDTERVIDLLTQRDRARKTKYYTKADALLEEARTSPRNGLVLRIHDDSRTFRIWTEEKPSFSKIRGEKVERRKVKRSEAETFNASDAYKRAITLVMKYEPDKVEETKAILEKFPGRECEILDKIEGRYID